MTTEQPPTAPPQAREEPFEHTEHGTARPDLYRWLHDTESPEVAAHLLAERAWYDVAVAHLRSLASDLTSEMVARVPATETSPTWRRRLFSYYTETPAGKEYPRICRKIRGKSSPDTTDSVSDTMAGDDFSEGPDGEVQVLLDVSQLAAGHDYVELGLTLVSPDENLLAWSSDTEGDEVYRLRFRDLRTGEDLAEEVPRTYYGAAWSADSRWFFYTVHDTAYRPWQVRRHRIGTDVADDVVVLEETDERFEVRVRGTRSGDWVVIWSESNTTAETWLVDAHDPAAPPRRAGGRRDGIRYRVDHRRHASGEDLLVVVDDRVEGRLMSAPVPGPAGDDHTTWGEVRPEDADVHLERADAFATGVVLSVRTGGTHQVVLVPHDDVAGPGIPVTSDAAGGGVHLATTTEYDADEVLVEDESWLTPPVWSRVSLATGERSVVLRRAAPGFDPEQYVVERLTFPSADGTPVPASVMRHRDTALDGTAPAVLYGYGAYGYTFEPEWDPALPSMLDRGVVWVHAHVRGGGEGGRAWYLDGKLAAKQHTFDDHVAVADGMASQGLVDPQRIASRGLSAGGLLQGVVFSQRPDRWRAVVAEVPFVDVVTTMFDEATPLTVTEWEEWGDPRVPEQLDWLLGYSPYDNLPAAGGRPDLLVTGAVHDPRVMVREPAKWVAALRASDPDWSPRCLFRCEVGAGAHAGPSGRFAHLAYEAEVYAWLLDRLGQLPDTDLEGR